MMDETNRLGLFYKHVGGLPCPCPGQISPSPDHIDFVLKSSRARSVTRPRVRGQRSTSHPPKSIEDWQVDDTAGMDGSQLKISIRAQFQALIKPPYSHCKSPRDQTRRVQYTMSNIMG
jgi:hypothetical protein